MPELPPDVLVQTLTDRTRLVLPTRPRTTPRKAALFPILFGLVFAGFALLFMASGGDAANHHPDLPEDPEAPALPEAPARAPAPRPPPAGFDWERLFLIAAGTPFLLVGLVPIAIGILMMFDSHAEIEVTPDHLAAFEKIGPLCFTRRRPLATVTGLRITTNFSGMQPAKGSTANYAVVAACSNARDLPLAPRYRRDLVTAVAGVVVQEMNRRGVTVTVETVEPPPSVADIPPPSDTQSPPDPASPPPAQPTGSTIIFAPTADGLTFIVPRSGFRGLAAFLLLFSLFWDTISFAVFAAFLGVFLHHRTFENVFPLLFISLFVFIGIAMSLWCIQVAFRRTVILATRDALVVTQAGPIRNSEYQWTPSALAAIRVGDSGTTVNNRRLKELQIHPKEPPKRGFFDGRDEAELLWIAGTLRAFYNL